MSYILDALMKSEKERQRGSIPSLDSQRDNEKGPPKGKKRWPYWLIGALVLNAVVLLWWMRPWEEKQSEPPVAAIPEATMQKKPMAKETVAPVVVANSGSAASEKQVSEQVPEEVQKQPAKAIGGKPEAVAPPPEVKPTVASTSESKGEEMAVEEFPSVQEAAPDESAGGDELLEADGSPEEELSVEAQNDADLGEASGEPVQNAEGSVVAGKQTTPGTTAAAAKNTLQSAAPAPDISRLPTSVLQGLPDISISLHLYSKVPKRRKVDVNGKMMGEGDSVDNLVVEEITPDGVIFSFQGKRFHKAVFH